MAVAPLKSRRIDWSQIVCDLEKTGLSQRQIAAECGFFEDTSMGKSWVNKLKNIPGTQPKFHHGALLLGLWVATFGADASAAPKEDAPPPSRQRYVCASCGCPLTWEQRMRANGRCWSCGATSEGGITEWVLVVEESQPEAEQR